MLWVIRRSIGCMGTRSFELVCAAASLTKDEHTLAFLDTYVACFMGHIRRTCGPFIETLYRGSYVTSIRSLTATLTCTDDIESDVRSSCFIPVLSGALSRCGRMDGCLSLWYAPPLDYIVIRAFFLFPLSSHTTYYYRGYAQTN